MVGLYDNPFAYDGPDFTGYLGQDQFASGSSPEDFHVHSATEPHFPASVHGLKGHHQPYHLSPTDPLGPSLDNGLPPAHLPRSAPTSYPIPPGGNGATSGGLTLDTMGLSWNTASSNSSNNNNNNNPNQPQPPSNTSNLTTTTDTQQLHTLLATLQAELQQAARERDEARMGLSTARNELYAARQVERRLRVERDEARSQAEFLGAERPKLKQAEARLRRERNEARLALMALKGKAGGGGTGKGGKRGVGGGGGGGVAGGVGGLVGGMESQGEDSGESPPMGMEQG